NTPAHGPAAFTTTALEMSPADVETPETRPAAVAISRTSTPSSSTAPVRRAHETLERDPRSEPASCIGLEQLGFDAERTLELVRGHEIAPEVLASDQEEVAVLRHVERDPVLLREPRDHRHAGEREPDVHLARELDAEPAGAGARRASGEPVLTLEQQHVARPRDREVVRRAGADHSPTHDDD